MAPATNRGPSIYPPNAAIEPALAGAVNVCTELPTPAGYVDNLLATDRGDLVLVECKLWRNPQARREVVGQIIDYAKDLSRWDFENLEDAVRRATPPPGIEKGAGFYSRVATLEGLDEPAFIDAVARNLKRGRFLLLLVGDGIQESVEAIASFLQGHTGLHFTLALVEMAIFELSAGAGYLINPSVVMRTTMIERGVVSLTDDRIEIRPSDTALKASGERLASSGRSIASTITEDMLLERLDAYRPGTGRELQSLLAQFAEIGVTTELMTASVKLLGRANDELWPLGTVQAKDATVWFEHVISTATGSAAAMTHFATIGAWQAS